MLCLTALVFTLRAANAAELAALGRVSDGDTVAVLDSPSSRQNPPRGSKPRKTAAIRRAAKQNLADLVYGKTVLVVWQARR